MRLFLFTYFILTTVVYELLKGNRLDTRRIIKKSSKNYPR